MQALGKQTAVLLTLFIFLSLLDGPLLFLALPLFLPLYLALPLFLGLPFFLAFPLFLPLKPLGLFLLRFVALLLLLTLPLLVLALPGGT